MLAIVKEKGTMVYMEYAKAEIRLAGSLENTVVKNVSAPEIAVLRMIHGEDAVVNVSYSHSDAEVTQKSERERLSKFYNPGVVEKLFPGAIGRLATTLAEVGIAVEVEAPAKPSKSKG